MTAAPPLDFDHTPWVFERHASEADRAAQQAFQATLATGPRRRLGNGLFLSPRASYTCDVLEIGDHSWVAAQVLLHGDVRLGRHCSLNPGCTVRGRVTLGDGVRVGYQAHLIGFEHRHEDLSQPMWQQGVRARGVTVGDDGWIGAGAIVLDGVTIGAHSIVAAGAVVTDDVPAWAVVAGNPARVLRDRRQPVSPPEPTLAQRLRAFGERIAEQWPAVLQRAEADDGQGGRCYADALAGPLRPWCDAVEIAAGFGALPALAPRAALVAQLQAAQDPATGLARPPGGQPALLGSAAARYGLLASGHALECLGARLRHPVRAVAAMSAEELQRLLVALPWARQAWSAGDWVDTIGAAIGFNQRHHGLAPGLAAPLFDWLNTQAQPHTGLWGQSTAEQGWLQPVNGFYRITRGTYANFGLPLPHPASTIDTVLAHARLHGGFCAGPAVNACNVLDVVHPLWLAGQQVPHRRGDIARLLEDLLADIPGRWHDGAGFAFAPGADLATPAGRPGLQGTEMWLAITHTAATALGLADEFPWRPQGIHRLAPPG
jgi:acetyltransferase-like isoleucine patch superfamily enzyme